MPSSMSKREERRYELQTRRWIAIPDNTYPYEYVPFPQSHQDLEPVIQAEKFLPWPTEPAHDPCRAWHPEDVWEIGALRKAIFNELQSVSETNHRTEDCLTHILHCWNANLKRYDSTGPSFLIHFLKLRYETGLNFWCLARDDARQVDVLAKACERTHVFSLFLARFHRTAHGSYGMLSTASGHDHCMMRVDGTACWLEDTMHAGGKEVRIRPSVTELDLLDEYYFEDEEADTLDAANGRGSEFWERAVSKRLFADTCANMAIRINKGLDSKGHSIEGLRE